MRKIGTEKTFFAMTVCLSGFRRGWGEERRGIGPASFKPGPETVWFLSDGKSRVLDFGSDNGHYLITSRDFYARNWFYRSVSSQELRLSSLFPVIIVNRDVREFGDEFH
jgi:hypothetical protein